jgi:signal transduction histidine kinase
MAQAVRSVLEPSADRGQGPDSDPGSDGVLLDIQRARVVAELAAITVHDFANVLAGVRVCAAMVSDQLAPDDPAQPLLQLIDDLTVNGCETGRRLTEFAAGNDDGAGVADVNDVVRAVHALTESHAKMDARVVLELAQSLPPAAGSPALLEQALTNLVLNAIEAMPSDGGQIVLRTRASISGQAAPVAIDVIDDGNGIAPEVLPYIFEPFFTTRGSSGGTGLGLASVRYITNRLGGDVDVESTPGAGTRFMLVLQAARLWPRGEAAG